LPQQNKVDIVFAGLPWVADGSPMMAPAVLKSIVEQEGYSSVSLDLNISFFKRMLELHSNDEDLIHFTVSHKITKREDTPKIVNLFSEEISYMAEQILSYDPTHIGLTVFSMDSRIVTKYLTFRLRQLAPEKKIVIGGPGLSTTMGDNHSDFAEELYQLGLIDCYIIGRGKDGILEYLKGNLVHNDTKMEYTSHLNMYSELELPYPNFKDYDFNQYINKYLPILESLGCVKNCDFCNIIEYWPKYQYKGSSPLFDEMVYQSKKYGINHFIMKNSLCNGNMRDFKTWLQLVADYNQENPNNQLSWTSYFILRSSHFHPESMFELIQKANGILSFGVETPIERVRNALGKEFSNEDIDYHLDMCRKYKIPVNLLLIGSQPGETTEDYKFIQQWIKDRTHYASDPIIWMNLHFANVIPGTGWDRKIDDDKKKAIVSEPGINYYTSSPDLFAQEGIVDIESRLEHWDVLKELTKPFQVSFPSI